MRSPGQGARTRVLGVGLAAQRIKPAQLARLEALVAEQRAMLDDAVRFPIADREFHEPL